jgi:DNA (cytosine-5)-methyltransferase 1
MSRPIAIDLFSGGGGLTEGLTRAGYEVAVAVDIDDSAAQTYTYNHPRTHFVRADLSEISIRKILRSLKMENLRIDLVAGSPPCEGFSQANRTNGGKHHPKNILCFKFIEAINELRPSIFLMENVPSILHIDRGQFVNELLAKCESMGYAAKYFMLNSVNFGVPQLRERFFLVGWIDGRRAPSLSYKNGRTNPITVKDAIIGDLPPISLLRQIRTYDYVGSPKTEYQKLIRGNSKKVYNHIVLNSHIEIVKRNGHIPRGGNFKSLPKRYRRTLRVTHSNMYKRLNLNKPSPTIVNIAKAMTWHPYQNRVLSVREAARMQSFPDDYLFFGPVKSMFEVVADAVPPLMAYAIARSLKAVQN